MSRSAPTLALAAVLAALLALPATASADTGCVTAGKQHAATALYGAGTQVVSTERIAGLRTALVLEPLIAPGTRHRMIATSDGWCDATTGFNAATGLRGVDAATVYARLAAAPYFDGVTVREVRSAGDVHTITTHALTNGVVATWVVATDAGGIRTATWRATGFAQRPFVAQVEGLTALPDATESYDRVAGGLLRERRGIPVPRAAEDDPGIGVGHTGSDGFRIEISYSEARTAPQLGQDVGVWDVDFIRITQRALAENYEEFLQWGLTSGWEPADRGWVYINDALSTACLACVLISNDFNIHLNSHAHDALEALGYRYPGTDPAEVWKDIIGHEMFHNFQNRYNKPGPVVTTRRRAVGFYYMEGTARMQEALHTYSAMSHQPESLIYANDGNGCNGFDGGGRIHVQGVTQSPDMDREMVKGPFNPSRTYSACYFWLPWYTTYGKSGLLDLVTTHMPAAGDIANENEEGIAATTATTGDSMLDQLKMFARHALTGGRGMNTFGAIAGGPAFDWAEHLEAWRPKPLTAGGSHTRTLQAGGMMANEIVSSVRVDMEGPKEVRMFLVHDDGTGTTVKSFKSGRRVSPPGDGERLWVVAARPEAGSGAVTLTAR
jgi:hypothetical protein